MQLFIKRYLLWIFYALFFACSAVFGAREGLIATESSLFAGKYILLALFALFLLFSLHATRHENFFRSIASMNRLLWGRQVGLDLYISVFLSLALIYLVEGSLAVVLLWLLPVLVFANLAILPYILFNYTEILGHFIG